MATSHADALAYRLSGSVQNDIRVLGRAKFEAKHEIAWYHQL
jgi:hypothetical protein